MGGKSSKSARAPKKQGKKGGAAAVEEKGADSRLENQAWKTPTRLEVSEKALSRSSSVNDLGSLSPTSETKIERMDSADLASAQDLSKELEALETSCALESVAPETEEVATVERPKPPRAAFETPGGSGEPSTAPEPKQRQEKIALPQLKVAPKKLNDISNIIENQAQMRAAHASTGAKPAVAAAPASQTPSPSGCRNIGYVSASPTPEAPKDEADLDVLQLTPDPTGHLSVLEDHADFGPLANDLGRKVLNFDESPAVLSRGQASPAPAFKSVFDDTDETLMQAILDAET